MAQKREILGEKTLKPMVLSEEKNHSTQTYLEKNRSV